MAIEKERALDIAESEASFNTREFSKWKEEMRSENEAKEVVSETQEGSVDTIESDKGNYSHDFPIGVKFKQFLSKSARQKEKKF